MITEAGSERCHVIVSEDGRKTKNVGDILKLKKQENGFMPRAPRKESSLVDTLILAQ